MQLWSISAQLRRGYPSPCSLTGSSAHYMSALHTVYMSQGKRTRCVLQIPHAYDLMTDCRFSSQEKDKEAVGYRCCTSFSCSSFTSSNLLQKWLAELGATAPSFLFIFLFPLLGVSGIKDYNIQKQPNWWGEIGKEN